MERFVYQQLLSWKTSGRRKPLLLQGARQVGKSYLLENFGQREFKNYHVFNFELDCRLARIFSQDLAPKRILTELSLHLGWKIDPKSDLIIFDEIQECPRAITSLKYFCEKMPTLALCCAGSLLGVNLSPEPFPVGKVEFLNLYPLSFEEFLLALDQQMLLEQLHCALDKGTLPEMAHVKLWERLKEYFVVGGMPEVISTYILQRKFRAEAMREARTIQAGLVESYYKDFAKHSGKINSIHIVSVFENVPMQLSRNIEGSVKRYKFKEAIHGKRSFAELQGPIAWLEKAGLLIKVKVCNRAELPLETFCKENQFKLFLFDIGLLSSMLALSPETVFYQDYGITKGYFAENFVAQELVAAGNKQLYSWTERNSEIEYLSVVKENIVPIEVKAGSRTRAKSLQQFLIKYKPERAVKISIRPLKIINGQVIQNIPIYLTGRIGALSG